MASRKELLSIIEECRISAPPNTIGERSLPLNFLDLCWIHSMTMTKLILYEFPHSKHHFIQTLIPNLKHSLSIALQHFFPFASNLIIFPPSHNKKPEVQHLEGDSVALTFAECHHLDFNYIKGNHPRECDQFYNMVPSLGNVEELSDGSMIIPLFSLQITFFPETHGITLGITSHHTVCDVSSEFHFMKAWSSISKHGTDELFLATQKLPLYDRLINKYPNTFDNLSMNRSGIKTVNIKIPYPHPNKVRAAIVLSRTEIDRLKRWVSIKLPNLEYISSLSVVCAYAWSCIAKSRHHIDDEEIEMGFEFYVDWRSRLNPPVPQSYYGNCVWPTSTATETSTVLSTDYGLLVAVELLAKVLSETKKNGLIKQVETWSKELRRDIPIISVTGSLKIGFSEMDFGCGKPIKLETLYIDKHGSISITPTMKSQDDIEIGVSLPTEQMDAFLTISKTELHKILNEESVMIGRRDSKL